MAKTNTKRVSFWLMSGWENSRKPQCSGVPKAMFSQIPSLKFCWHQLDQLQCGSCGWFKHCRMMAFINSKMPLIVTNKLGVLVLCNTHCIHQWNPCQWRLGRFVSREPKNHPSGSDHRSMQTRPACCFPKQSTWCFWDAHKQEVKTNSPLQSLFPCNW